MGRIQILGISGLLLYTLLATSFWSNLGRDFQNDGLEYNERRIKYAFNQLPVDQIAQRLDETLPRTTAVSFGPSVARSDFLMQRLTEALYPRVVLAQDAQVVDLATLASSQATKSPVKLDFSLFGFLVSLISALGFGAMTLLVLRRPIAIEFLPGTLIVAGSVIIGLLATIATWFQIAFSSMLVLWTGVVFAAAALAIAWRRRLLRKPLPPKVETYIFIGLLLLFLVRMVEFPVTLWDGRSVWLFAAKKLYFNGMMTKFDLTHSAFQFSNPSYPLLMPAWLGHFTSWNGTGLYNERMATLGYPVFFAALLSLWWVALRQTLGRWLGAATTLALFFMFENMTSGGYTDQLVALAIGFALYSFRKQDTAFIGWLALIAASLMKAEGLVFGLLTALFYIFFQKPKSTSRLASVLPLLCFLPAFIHRLWTRSVGVKDIFQDSNHSLGDMFSRVGELFGLLPTLFEVEGYTATRFVSRAGFVAFVLGCAVLLWLIKQNRNSLNYTHRLGSISLGLCIVSFAVCCLVVAAVPFDVNWFFGVTVDRLLLMPSLFAISSLLLLTAQDRKHNNQ